ncbi:MAG: hypothetical protein QOK43_176 [Acidimicrobiaceae bacterium]|nr:hypothetical protein [Acidimicrobiaceae bacterium]
MVGPGRASSDQDRDAEAIGRGLGLAGATVVCGGLGGVMAAACRGARAGGGITVGLLPGDDRDEGNRWLDVAVATGLGEARNALVVRAADVVVAVGGEYGTLSEIALALKTGKPVVGLRSWGIDGMTSVGTADEAVTTALSLAGAAQPASATASSVLPDLDRRDSPRSPNHREQPGQTDQTDQTDPPAPPAGQTDAPDLPPDEPDRGGQSGRRLR